MRKRSPSAKTAFAPMVIAACEQYIPEARRLIRDDLAFRFLPPALQAMVSLCKRSFIRRTLMRAAEKDAPGSWAGIACRKRYIDEKATDAIRAGVDALVFLGAGLDTRACRLAAPNGVDAYEIDQPANIHLKRDRLRRLYGRIPEHLTLVAVDFEADDLGASLAANGFRIGAATLLCASRKPLSRQRQREALERCGRPEVRSAGRLQQSAAFGNQPADRSV